MSISLLISVIREPSSSLQLVTAMATATAALAGTLAFGKKQKRMMRKAAWKQAWQQLWKGKKEKESGAAIIMFLLLLIAGVAVLWVLWELAGWFGLIGGIVAGLMFLGLVFGKD